MEIYLVLGVLILGPSMHMIIGLFYHRLLLVRLDNQKPKWAYWRWRSYAIGSMVSTLMILGYFYYGWEIGYFMLMYVVAVLGGYICLGMYHVEIHNTKRSNLNTKTYRDTKEKRKKAAKAKKLKDKAKKKTT